MSFAICPLQHEKPNLYSNSELIIKCAKSAPFTITKKLSLFSVHRDLSKFHYNQAVYKNADYTIIKKQSTLHNESLIYIVSTFVIMRGFVSVQNSELNKNCRFER